MKKLFLLVALVAFLGACSTATLININVDGDSFIPAANRTTTQNVTAGPAINIPIPENGLAVPLPSLSFLTRIALKIDAGIVSSVSGAINGTLELYVGPSSATNVTLYDPSNKVPTGANCTGDLTVDGTTPVKVNLSLTASSPTLCANAFNRIKSGQFKIGARVSFVATSNTTVTINLTNFDVGVSGYPVQILK